MLVEENLPESLILKNAAETWDQENVTRSLECTHSQARTGEANSQGLQKENG